MANRFTNGGPKTACVIKAADFIAPFMKKVGFKNATNVGLLGRLTLHGPTGGFLKSYKNVAWTFCARE